MVLVFPGRKRIRQLESRLAIAHAEHGQAAPPAVAAGNAYLASQQYAGLVVTREPGLQAWVPESVAELEELPATDSIRHPVREPERAAFEEPAAQQHTKDEDAEDIDGTQHVRPETPAGEPLTYAFGAEDLDVPDGVETAFESTPALPKRQPRESRPEGFDWPRPSQPSMRVVERREPPPETSTSHSGSLFEPVVQPGQVAVSPAPEPSPGRYQVADSVPPGPFGPGSAMPRPGGGCPSDEFGVKASVTALRYCTEDSAQFERMVAEVWFRTPADAERVGFHPLT